MPTLYMDAATPPHSVWHALTRRKTLHAARDSSSSSAPLKRTFTAIDLVLYGVGSSVGAGIFVLVGLGAHVAGPSIGLSFLLTGAACMLTSLAYAEFASHIPVAGSAFTYTYVAFGEFPAWMVGWNLLLGYGFTASVCSRAWADYTGTFVQQLFPHQTWITTYLTEWHLFSTEYACSPLSAVIIAISTAVILQGAEESSKFNNGITLLNIANLLLVVMSGLVSHSIQIDNWEPFAPQGLPGIIQGAGLVFFAYIGFDMVASLSEEVIHPERNLPIGIVGSLIVSTLLYVIVAMAVVGMAPIALLGQQVPILHALTANACCTHVEQLLPNAAQVCLQSTCHHWLNTIARIVSGGAIAGLIASSFTSLMGTPRILMRMSLDGLWFPLFAQIHPVTQVPSAGITATGIATGLLACFAPLDGLANLISLGTLMVFTFVDAGVILLRLRTIAETEARVLKANSAVLHSRMAVLLFVCTVAVVCASILWTHTHHMWLVYVCLAVAAVAAALIRWLPRSWTLVTNSGAFSCPWVPSIPLGGLVCNAAMMGSLPLSSWLFALVWLSLGTAIYFLYGIYHSALAQNNKVGEEVPLMVARGGESHTSLPLLTPHLPRPNLHERIN
ncbi:basic amino acid/polyamine antiporter, APA family [Fistulifera solaris]|uniref:Basic amino acid/polyamine antiporter, APA family n=1 Tax=Fistulifera solaris TaxID=1519565 RepID=A0A1Z5K0B1_FISSO|nr:basic amino acid/polyamine antiporter, APA family [Fistulifera solaris]|eukprot:GAX19750.1 basic amino acid/polyamine antiporter, APA family [Fistulifera solaris]